ncbi:MAG: N4-gp56 family major capsid protein [Synergistaceae bacterium]|nr:N4-gp56 family major capsid protein [Synergistaceae bacterium]
MDIKIKLVNLCFFDVNTSNFPTEIKNYYDRVALAQAIPFLPFRKWGQKRPLPKNRGKVIEFRRWGLLAPATTPLSEGITPVGSSLSHETITATVAQYGDWIPLTDQVQDLAIDPVLTTVVQALGEQQGETLAILSRNQMMSGTNVNYAGGVAARSAVVAKVSAADYDRIIRKLKMKMAKRHTEIILPTVKIATQPIRAAYIAIVSPYTVTDLEAQLGSSGYVPREKYASGMALEGEVGAYKEIRFIESTHAMVYEDAGGDVASGCKSTSGTKTDVYVDLIFGKEAYGETMVGGKGTHSVIIKTHKDDDTSDTSDPLNQRGTAGWKDYYTAKILNDDWLVRYEHAVGN